MLALAGEAGEVSRAALVHALDISLPRLANVLAELEAAGLIRRAGKTRGARLFLKVSCLFRQANPGCEVCSRPSTAGRFCARCKQGFRADRAWREEALRLHVEGKSPYAIAIALNRPLRTHFADDDGVYVDGVINWLVSERLIDDGHLRYGVST